MRVEYEPWRRALSSRTCWHAPSAVSSSQAVTTLAANRAQLHNAPVSHAALPANPTTCSHSTPLRLPCLCAADPENCGATEGLLRCSRCHAAWFCSLQCHKVAEKRQEPAAGTMPDPYPNTQRAPLLPHPAPAPALCLRVTQSYWPFHKSACRRNDFADAVEQQEPQFAAWMRGHGKLAVLQVTWEAGVERRGGGSSVVRAGRLPGRWVMIRKGAGQQRVQGSTGGRPSLAGLA